MSDTALDTIKGALRALGVLYSGETPTGEEGQDALKILNRMLHGFAADGIAYAHTTIGTISDPLPFPDEQAGHVMYLLAVYIAPEYGKAPSDVVVAAAENGRRYLQAAYTLATVTPVDRALQIRRRWATLAEWTAG